MKRINILLAIAFCFLITSCEDFLDAPSKSTLDEDVIFSTPALAESAIIGITQSFAETNSYRGRFLPWYGANTDCEWYNSSDKYPDGKADLAVYGTTPDNNQMNTTDNAWAKMYEGIERANLAIRGLRNSGKATAGTDLGHLLGEALTLRAVYYADLVKAWGDVPARFEPISSETLYISKSDRDVIYKQLIADLGEAENLTYWPNENTYTKTVSRINKAFVKGLRARLCLAASGYSQRPDSDTPRLSNDPELSKDILYPIAEAELLELYQTSKAGSMESSFETVFRKLCQEDRTAGGESMWEIPFSENRGRMAYTFAPKHNVADQYTAMAQGSQIGPTPNFFYDYDVKDLRRDVTCVPYQWSASNPSKQELKALNNWSFGKYRFEWMTRKITSSSANDDGLHKQYMRFSEVVLMLAEVENYLHGATAAAPYLKEIRRRAFAEADWTVKVDNYVDALTTKEAMLNAIIDENAYEFAGEMLRKESLIRWNLLGTKLADTKVRMVELRERRDRYSDVPATVYYKYAADNESLITYGLNRGETDNVSASYPNSVEWVGTGKLKDEKINALYVREPDKYQFWPIWKTFIDNSNGKLANDYGY
ncbi:MAG: RagB/SusD family nutrient uptake outer membrane protein [Dysgonomonas sp.]